jgi:hypothetical protein
MSRKKSHRKKMSRKKSHRKKMSRKRGLRGGSLLSNPMGGDEPLPMPPPMSLPEFHKKGDNHVTVTSVKTERDYYYIEDFGLAEKGENQYERQQGQFLIDRRRRQDLFKENYPMYETLYSKRELIISWEEFSKLFTDQRLNWEVHETPSDESIIESRRKVLNLANPIYYLSADNPYGVKKHAPDSTEYARDQLLLRARLCQVALRFTTEEISRFDNANVPVPESSMQARSEFLSDFYREVSFPLRFNDVWEEEGLILRAPTITTSGRLRTTHVISRNIRGTVDGKQGTYTFTSRRLYTAIKKVQGKQVELSMETFCNTMNQAKVKILGKDEYNNIRLEMSNFIFNISRDDILNLVKKCRALLIIWMNSLSAESAGEPDAKKLFLDRGAETLEAITDMLDQGLLERAADFILRRNKSDKSDKSDEEQILVKAITMLNMAGFMIEVVNTLHDPFEDAEGEWEQVDPLNPLSPMARSVDIADRDADGVEDERVTEWRAASAPEKDLSATEEDKPEVGEWLVRIADRIGRVGKVVVSGYRRVKDIGFTSYTFMEEWIWWTCVEPVVKKIGIYPFMLACRQQFLRDGMDKYKSTGDGIDIQGLKRVLGSTGQVNQDWNPIDRGWDVFFAVRDEFKKLVEMRNTWQQDTKISYLGIMVSVALNKGKADAQAIDLWNTLCSTMSGCEISGEYRLQRKMVKKIKIANALVDCIDDPELCSDALSHLSMTRRLDVSKFNLLLNGLLEAKREPTTMTSFLADMTDEARKTGNDVQERLKRLYTGNPASDEIILRRFYVKASSLIAENVGFSPAVANYNRLQINQGDVINVISHELDDNTDTWLGWIANPEKTQDEDKRGEKEIGWFVKDDGIVPWSDHLVPPGLTDDEAPPQSSLVEDLTVEQADGIIGTAGAELAAAPGDTS